jgi:uncharacterized SAM-binding protein YcdF (DUF218 family)
VDFVIARKVLAALVLPPTGPLLVALAGLALLGARPRLGRALAWLGAGALLMLSLPVVSHALLRSLEPPALDLRRPGEAQAIVILGGGVRRNAAEFGGDTLARLTLERVRYGALVARATRLPVLVSGGSVYGGTAEATLMKRALEQEFNVEVRWSEERSRDTRSNAAETASILLPAGITHVILVAHGFDMPRASAEFAAAGLHVTPAPTVIAGERFTFEHPAELLPSMSALQGSYYALYELLAEAARHLRPSFTGSAP